MLRTELGIMAHELKKSIIYLVRAHRRKSFLIFIFKAFKVLGETVKSLILQKLHRSHITKDKMVGKGVHRIKISHHY